MKTKFVLVAAFILAAGGFGIWKSKIVARPQSGQTVPAPTWSLRPTPPGMIEPKKNAAQVEGLQTSSRLHEIETYLDKSGLRRRMMARELTEAEETQVASLYKEMIDLQARDVQERLQKIQARLDERSRQ